LQSDTAKASSDAALPTAPLQCRFGRLRRARARRTKRLSTSQSNSTAIEAINEKIDRMFKKSVSK